MTIANISELTFAPLPKGKSRFRDLSGKAFTRWTVLGLAGKINPKSHNYYFWCICECGTIKAVAGWILSNGKSKSCGCLKIDSTRERATVHGYARPGQKGKEYITWVSIKSRCDNINHEKYYCYGARDITVCARWREDFRNFLADMGTAPSKEHSIERINNDKHYSCGHCTQCKHKGWTANCTWGTDEEQGNNKTTTYRVPYNGDICRLIDLERRFKIPRRLIYERIVTLGWSVNQAVKTPVRRYRTIEIDGIIDTIPGWARTHGTSPWLIESRLARGITGIALFAPPSDRKRYICIDGTPKSINQWADELGADPGVIHARLAKGWSERKAVTEPVKRDQNRYITFNSQTKTVQEWARHLGMPVTTLKGRLNTSGWSVAKALTTPVRI